MSRLVVIAAVIGSCLLIWKSGVLDGAINSVTGGPVTTATPLDPGVEISKASTVMQNLKSLHVSLTGNLVLNRIAGVQVTGQGDLTYPHKETLSMQFQVPTASGQDAVLAMNERIEGGHEYIQYPAQSQAWQDVTGNTKSQILPEMDPIANLDFAQAFRASDDQGDITMDNIDVHHFSLTVDPAKYVAQLKTDPTNGITPADEAILSGSTIQVDVWVSASDHYIHQMKIDWVNSQFTWDVTYHYSNFVTGGGTTSA